MLLAYWNLLFCSFEPIWLKDGKWYPFLVTVQIHPLSIMVYSKVQFSVPYCFFCTHNHSHKSLTDTQFPIVNLPMIAKCTVQCHVNIFTLISNMQSCVADVNVWMMQNKLQLNNEKTEALLIDPQNSPNFPLLIIISGSEITMDLQGLPPNEKPCPGFGWSRKQLQLSPMNRGYTCAWSLLQSHMMYTSVISLNEISILTPALKSRPLNKDKGWVEWVGLD